MAHRIEFYFDFASPYAYLGSIRLEALAERHQCAIDWRPLLLGAVFKVTGVRPNMEQPLRGDYLRRDTLRCARLWEIPFRFPEQMPTNALIAARAYYWLAGQNPTTARAFARLVFNAHWVEGRDLAPMETIAELGAQIGIERSLLIAAAGDPAIKQRLRDETERAIARGVFGAPFFFVDGEPFWGADRIDQIEQWLERGGW